MFQNTFNIQLIYIILIVGLILFMYYTFYASQESFIIKNNTNTNFDNTVYRSPCPKWYGNLKSAPNFICKDCGYPSYCHGPYRGDTWRHIFIE